MGKEGREGGHKWNVWLAVWVGPIISTLCIILYVLLLDVDPPEIKPRYAIENASATLVYFANAGNIIASFILAGALLQQEYSLLLVWMCWGLLYAVLTAIVIPLSLFSLLRYIPARVIIHATSLLSMIWSFYTIFRVYRFRDIYEWGSDPHRRFQRQSELQGETNNRITGESNIL